MDEKVVKALEYHANKKLKHVIDVIDRIEKLGIKRTDSLSTLKKEKK